jgi:hypothetical protein
MQEDSSNVNKLSALESGIIKTLLYFSIFDYPLTQDELVRYIRIKIIDENIFQSSLDELLQKKLIYRINGFILLIDNEDFVRRRLNANRLTKKYLPIAFKFSKILFHFPFVRGVCLSGSISKNNFYEGNDIDFFIITEKKRIWFVRLLIICYLKTLGKKRCIFFCVNYFIERGSSINPMNIFTATELMTLIPTSGINTCLEFINQNKWINQYFPNFIITGDARNPYEPALRLKRFMEFISSNKLFDFMNFAIMKFMIKRMQWKIKTERLKVVDTASFFGTVNRNMIKVNEADNSQSRILHLLDLAIKEFEYSNNILLPEENE